MENIRPPGRHSFSLRSTLSTYCVHQPGGGPHPASGRRGAVRGPGWVWEELRPGGCPARPGGSGAPDSAEGACSWEAESERAGGCAGRTFTAGRGCGRRLSARQRAPGGHARWPSAHCLCVPFLAPTSWIFDVCPDMCTCLRITQNWGFYGFPVAEDAEPGAQTPHPRVRAQHTAPVTPIHLCAPFRTPCHNWAGSGALRGSWANFSCSRCVHAAVSPGGGVPSVSGRGRDAVVPWQVSCSHPGPQGPSCFSKVLPAGALLAHLPAWGQGDIGRLLLTCFCSLWAHLHR